MCVYGERRSASCPRNHYFSDGPVLSGSSGPKFGMIFNHLKVPGGKDKNWRKNVLELLDPVDTMVAGAGPAQCTCLCCWKSWSRRVVACPHCMVEGQVEKPGSHRSEQLHPKHAAHCHVEMPAHAKTHSVHMKRPLLSTKLISSSTALG